MSVCRFSCRSGSSLSAAAPLLSQLACTRNFCSGGSQIIESGLGLVGDLDAEDMDDDDDDDGGEGGFHFLISREGKATFISPLRHLNESLFGCVFACGYL